MKIIADRLILFLLVLLVISCQNEDNYLEQDLNQSNINTPMSIDWAKNIFYSNQGQINETYNSFILPSSEDYCLSFEPIWSLSDELNTADNLTILTVPVRILDNEIIDGTGAQLVFFPNQGCTTPVELVLYQSPLTTSQRLDTLANCTFTGAIASVNFCDCTTRGFNINNGVIEDEISFPINDLYDVCLDSTSLSYRNEVIFWFLNMPDGCWDASKGKTWRRIGKFFSSLWNSITGSSSSGGGSGGWSGFFGTGHFPYYNTGQGINYLNAVGGGGGLNASINSIFDGTFFNGEGQLVLNMLDDLIAENDLFICIEQFHQELYQCLSLDENNLLYCVKPSHFSSSPDELNVDGYIRILNNINPSNSCLSDLISTYYDSSRDIEPSDGNLLCAINENNDFDITNEDLFDLIKDNCSNDVNCQIDALECLNRISNYQDEYNVQFTDHHLEDVLFINSINICGASDNDFEEYLDFILEFTIASDPSKVIDLASELTDCFGEPDSNGNYLDCSSYSGNLSVTIYADQPVPFNREVHIGRVVGHTFVSLNFEIGGEDKNLVLGFYPTESNITPTFNRVSTPEIRDDGERTFDVSVKFELTCNEFNQQIKEFLEQSSETYHLDNYNCTDFAIESINDSSNCGIPSSQGGCPGGSGSNPGYLGEDLRTLNCGTLSEFGGTAPISGCN